jgi:hypothetical protein
MESVGPIPRPRDARDAKPPFQATDTLVASIDLGLPATFSNTLFHLEVLDPQDPNKVEEFLRRSLDFKKLNKIHRYLWLAGLPGAKVQPFHHQKMLLRDLVIVERIDLHLVWFKSRIFVKPLPDYLLNYDFWKNLCNDRELYEAACGLLLSYISLIRYDHDLRIAQEAFLINRDITWRQWTEFVCRVSQHLGLTNLFMANKRFDYGELRLARLNMIYRLWGLMQGYCFLNYHNAETWRPFIEQYNNAISAFGLIDDRFQEASFGFTVLSIILPVVMVGFSVFAATSLILLNLFAVFTFRRRQIRLKGIRRI